jgi:predicted site-specific integrase-resolvase
LLNQKEAAPLLGVSPATLRSWRCRGIGPVYVKMARGQKSPVRYKSR